VIQNGLKLEPLGLQMPLNNIYNRYIFLIFFFFFLDFSFSNQSSTEKVLSKRKIKLLNLSDLQSELNKFQSDCLKLLKNPMINAAQIEVIEIDDELSFVRVSGKSLEGTRVKFGLDKWYFEPFENESFEFAPNWKEKPIHVESDGYFQFTVQIPKLKSLRISLQFEYKAIQYYNLEVDFSDKRKIESVFLRPFFVEEQRKQFCTKSRFSLDLGGTLFSYRQSLDSAKGRLEYISTHSPAYAISVDWAQNPESDQNFSYQVAPGILQATEGFKIDEKYKWEIFDYHYSYGQKNWIKSAAGNLIYNRIKLGLQYHNIPLSEATTARQLFIKPSQIANALIGLNLKMYSDKYWMFEFQFDIQYPFYSSFDLSYDFMFDGSAGAFFSTDSNFLYGIKLSSHMHQFSYDKGLEYFDRSGSISFMQTSLQLSVGRFF
jgi:hypothetical protein